MPETLPVLINGAGPTGLVIALSLRRNGVAVRIIDKETQPRNGERGAGISPRSLELHRILGTFPEIMDLARPLPLTREYDPADSYNPTKTYSLIPVIEETPHIPDINPLMIGQNYHEKVLRLHLEKLGTSVEFGTELKAFTQSADSVIAELVKKVDGKETVEKSEFPYLIGADGAHSIVRRTLGLEFLGETLEGHNMIVGDIKVTSGPREFWDRWGTKTTILSFRPSLQDPEVLNFLIAGDVNPEKVMASRDTLLKEFYDISGREDITFGEILWQSRYRPNIRMVKELRVGRVFVAGDAAHCHSPVGGQGLNSSIQDAFNLGWKLSLVQRGLASATLLDTYQEERLPIIAEMLNKTTELHKKVVQTGGAGKVNRGKDMSQLGVNYRGSSIVYDEEADATSVKWPGYNTESETAARAGDRAPEAPGLLEQGNSNQTTSLFGIFSPSKHTVLVFLESTEERRVLLELLKRAPANAIQSVLILKKDGPSSQDDSFDQVLIDSQNYAHAGYHIDKSTILVVRPDGVIGARVHSAVGVDRYLKGIFI